jgi:uncharacterized protein YecE (DUF72 family)
LSQILNKKHSYAFEFREKAWLDNESVIKLFTKHRWIIVISHVANINHWAGGLENGFNPKLKDWTPTSNNVYIRMHGTKDQYTGSYNNSHYRAIFDFIKTKPIHSAYVYFNNTDESTFAFDNAIKLTSTFNPINLSINN